jgi:GntR family transcriptional regulator of abcA and norABC
VPKGGYYIWLRLQYPMNMKKLFDEALASGLLLSPDYLFDTNISHCLRISYAGHGVRELKNGLKILSRIIRNIIKNDYKNYGIHA